MWNGEVVQMDSDRYYELRADGWEPTNFILIPDPRPAQGLATPNGGGLVQSFVTFVGMKKWSRNAKARRKDGWPEKR